METLQKFASLDADVHNHFSLERHLVDCQTCNDRRSAAPAEWQILASKVHRVETGSRDTGSTLPGDAGLFTRRELKAFSPAEDVRRQGASSARGSRFADLWREASHRRSANRRADPASAGC